jgi:hypothetical protein
VVTPAAFACLIGLAVQAGAPVLTQAAEALEQRKLPEASAMATRLARTAAPGEPPARSLTRLVDALYQELQFDGALASLELAGRYGPISKEDQAQLALRRGLLWMESFEEAKARRSFQDALALDRSARLPAFAPPKTVHLLEELRSALPPPTVVMKLAPAPPPPPGLRSWAWAPAAGGAAMGIAGGVLYLLAKGNYDRLAARDPSLTTPEQVHAAAETGRLQQTWSAILLGGSAVALGSAVGLTVVGTFP